MCFWSFNQPTWRYSNILYLKQCLNEVRWKFNTIMSNFDTLLLWRTFKADEGERYIIHTDFCLSLEALEVDRMFLKRTNEHVFDWFFPFDICDVYRTKRESGCDVGFYRNSNLTITLLKTISFRNAHKLINFKAQFRVWREAKNLTNHSRTTKCN